eukprot:143241_1
MGAWYSGLLIQNISSTVKEFYSLEISHDICEIIVWYSLHIVTDNGDDINIVKFDIDNIKLNKSCNLEINFLGKDNKNDVINSIDANGIGILLEYPSINQHEWKFEMFVKQKFHAMAIGIVDYEVFKAKKFKNNVDFECNKGVYGYYHGGSSLNMCSNGKRENVKFDGIDNNWINKKIGIQINFDKNELIPLNDGKLLTKCKIQIPDTKSYCFHIW